MLVMEDNCYDAIVIGGGPSGLFSTLELARNGQRVALLEKGGYIADSLCPKVRENVSLSNLKAANLFRSQCIICTCLQGIGGAAFHFDCNLGYIRKMSRSKIEQTADGTVRQYSSLEQALGSFEQARQLIMDVYNLFYEFGLPRNDNTHLADSSFLNNERVFVHTDTEDSLLIPLDTAFSIIQKIEQTLLELGVHILVWTPAEVIERGNQGRWRIIATPPEKTPLQLEADSIVIGVGKSALPWVLKMLDYIGITYEKNNKVDVGVRLETRREDMAAITNACHNPKLTFLSHRGEPVRTFCVCDGGRLMQYQMAGVTILDGQHCINNPTSQTNFGILTTVTLTDGVSGTDYALNFARIVNLMGQGKPLVQQLSDFMEGHPTTSLDDNEVQTSLVSYTLGDLTKCLPSFLVENSVNMVSHLNEISPGCIQPYSLLAAPVIERIYPSIDLDHNMETSQPGIFIVGDSSSKVMGITSGAATGLRAARTIINRKS